MSKIKITLLVASCILLLGIVLGVIGIAMGGIDSFLQGGSFMDSNYHTEQFEAPASQVTSIVITDQDSEVILRASTDDMVRVYYAVSDRRPFDVTLQDGALTGTRSDLRKWYNYISFGLYTDSYTTIVEVPASFTGDITLHSTNGKITAGGTDIAGALSLRTTNGSVDLDGLQVRDGITVETTNGRIHADNLTTASLRCTSSNGQLHIAATVSESVALETSNGAIQLDLYGEPGSITARSSNGKIAGQIHANQAAYRVTAQTSNGNCNLDDTDTGSKTLELRTTNGEINVILAP